MANRREECMDFGKEMGKGRGAEPTREEWNKFYSWYDDQFDKPGPEKWEVQGFEEGHRRA